MAKTTRIIGRRKQREQTAVRKRQTWQRLIFGLITALFGLIFLTICSVVVGLTAVVSAFTQELPDFTQIEQIGTGTDTFETTKSSPVAQTKTGMGNKIGN